MRVLYLSWRDRDNPEAGGAETFTERTAEVLTEMGDRVTIFTSRFPGASPTDRHGNVDIVRRGGRFTCYPLGLWYAARHRRDFDVVLDVQNGVPFWAPLLARRPVVNITHHVHRDQWSVIFGPRLARLGWFLESRIAPVVYRRSRYVTVSQASRDDLVELGIDADRIDIVYSGNDRPAALEQSPVHDRSDTPVLTVLGRLVPHKQVEIAIDIVAELLPAYPQLRLDVIGAGYWHEALVRYATDRGVLDRIDFHGFVDDDTKHRLLGRSWLLLMPSHKEGWGLTIVEAGLHETPAIAFAHAGGPTESILHGETGLLALNPQQMSEQVGVLLGDESLRSALGRAARGHALGFDWQRSGRALAATLRSVLGHAPRPQQPAGRPRRLRSVHEIAADHREVGEGAA
ncbi:glycosyltransferase family 4 protein [Flexivirga sp. ID2601S]|uniref:D-inositol 3-phosphate glycosyltransferase n=2 Tax=Flexivirga aerilata TaxID=1656889 RepID=A0A849AWY9_9MICO|nr:glycosyltransferase family 4 protein [Flexivirga aerilata]NNG41182.1 glycosyltransferase family 4 protein [Flexivirga aerilata]